MADRQMSSLLASTGKPVEKLLWICGQCAACWIIVVLRSFNMLSLLTRMQPNGLISWHRLGLLTDVARCAFRLRGICSRIPSRWSALGQSLLRARANNGTEHGGASSHDACTDNAKRRFNGIDAPDRIAARLRGPLALLDRCQGTVTRLGVRRPVGYLRVCSLAEGGCVAWMVRLVKVGAEGEGPCADVMEIRRPDDLVDIANLSLTLAEVKRLLAGVQREIVAAQARGHAVRRPSCACCGDVCRLKDYRDHAVSTLFGPVTLRLPAFVVPRVAGSRLALAGHRTAGRHRSWTGFGRISRP